MKRNCEGCMTSADLFYDSTASSTFSLQKNGTYYNPPVLGLSTSGNDAQDILCIGEMLTECFMSDFMLVTEAHENNWLTYVNL